MNVKTTIGLLSAFTVLFYWLEANLTSFYIFKPQRLQELAKLSIERHPDNVTALMHDLNGALREEYGEKHIMPFTTDSEKWIWSPHGSAMGSFTILHASVTEYLIFYGTPMYSSGHSGLHMADDYFTILHGFESAYRQGDLEATVYKPGDVNYLPRGQTIHYAMNGWALELAQGWIPTMLPFGFLDTFTSNWDFPNFWKTTVLTAQAMTNQLLVGKF